MNLKNKLLIKIIFFVIILINLFLYFKVNTNQDAVLLLLALLLFCGSLFKIIGHKFLIILSGFFMLLAGGSKALMMEVFASQLLSLSFILFTLVVFILQLSYIDKTYRINNGNEK